MEDRCTLNPVADLGTTDYAWALELQRKIVNKVKKGEIGDVLLFLSHLPVYTVGRGKRPENYYGVEVIDTERGGDVTYHGPGQLVVYPIFDLEKNGIMGARKFVQVIEDVIISSIGSFGFVGEIGDEPGIWVEGKKIASIGLAIRESVSFHGVAINISEEVIPGFSKINPCGLHPDTIGFVKIDREKLIAEIRANFERAVHKFDDVAPSFFYELART